jgi:hypothetical protein
MEHWAAVLSLSAVLLAIIVGLGLTLGYAGRRQRGRHETRREDGGIDFTLSHSDRGFSGVPPGGYGDGGPGPGDGGAGGHGH